MKDVPRQSAGWSKAYLLLGGSAQPHAGQEQVPPFFSTVAHFTVSYIIQ